ncbi:MAG: S46 family peptidase, partial [Nannocystaceae bacterium]
MLPAPPSPPRAPRPPRRRRLAVARWLAAAVACSAGAPGIASADEGQWTPDQISTLDLTAARSRGLELTPEQLWDPNGGGLMRAVVNLGGCTASFVSQDGLIATNHHCAYGALQSQSTVEHDYLKDGFLARSRADELEARGKTVRVLESIEDVTPRVTAAIAAAADDRGRGAAIERVEKELVAACEDEPQLRCQVAAFYGGNDYRLLRYRELLDVRLVYAPPSAIGEYGGEIDNWMWPRHTGDFSLLRAYTSPAGAPAPFAAENVPYKPAQWLRAATEGVAPGEFVAVMGYPGHTDRYLPAVEVRRQVEQVLPTRIELYGAWIALL